MNVQVIDVLRRFLPKFRAANPALTIAKQRAIWAITHCRTPVMGGHAYQCPKCKDWEFGAHSCNNRACPQCGSSATAKWVERELEKRVGAPYFMVTFTLPSEFRNLFFGKGAKEAYDMFFSATSKALSEKLADEKDLEIVDSGFTGVLHTWNQRLHFHPHIHYIVPGCGLDKDGNVVSVKYRKHLVNIYKLKGAFREHIREEMKARRWETDPAAWRKNWGIDIKAFGDGENIIKYLGRYVCRTAIGNCRIVSINHDDTVTFTWKDRSNKAKVIVRKETIAGLEFVTRYLRHVLPRGLRSIRYYGFCHPASKKKRARIAFHTGMPLQVGVGENPNKESDLESEPHPGIPKCSCCGIYMQRLMRIPPSKPVLGAKKSSSLKRGPPGIPNHDQAFRPIAGAKL
jgi:hypothetical protein